MGMAKCRFAGVKDGRNNKITGGVLRMNFCANLKIIWTYLCDNFLYLGHGLLEVVDDVAILQGEELTGLRKNEYNEISQVLKNIN